MNKPKMARFSKLIMLFALKLNFNGVNFKFKKKLFQKVGKIRIKLENICLTISLNICNQKFIEN